MKGTLEVSAFAVGLLALLLLPGAAQAAGAGQCNAATSTSLIAPEPDPQPIIDGPCSMVCSPTISCSFGCIDDNDRQTDCGSYGLCDPCKEGIVEVGREEIGRSAREYIIYCEYVLHERVYWKSVNAGCTVFTTCEKDTVGWGINISCCQAWGCWGQQCP